MIDENMQDINKTLNLKLKIMLQNIPEDDWSQAHQTTVTQFEINLILEIFHGIKMKFSENKWETVYFKGEINIKWRLLKQKCCRKIWKIIE